MSMETGLEHLFYNAKDYFKGFSFIQFEKKLTNTNFCACTKENEVIEYAWWVNKWKFIFYKISKIAKLKNLKIIIF